MSSSRPPAAATGRKSHGFLRGLVAALLSWWLSVQAAHAFGYTGGTAQVQARSEGLRTTVGVRERLGSLARKRADGTFKAPGGSKSRAASSGRKDDEREARIFTSRLKEAETAAQLLGILDEAVEVPYFNYFHASAAYHSLATFHRKGLLDGCGGNPVIPKLQARVDRVIKEQAIIPQSTANLLWALAVLIEAIPNMSQFLPALLKVLPTAARRMKAQELANSLWATAQLKDAAPEVLSIVPALTAQIPSKSDNMKPQELSNCLWASAHMMDVAPDVLSIVPALVEQIAGKADCMNPQELSNCMWASAQLKNAGPEVLSIVPALVAQIPSKAQEMKPQELSNCLWASAHLKDVAPDEIAMALPGILPRILGKAREMIAQDFSNLVWSLVILQDSGLVPAAFAGSMMEFARLAALRLGQVLPSLKRKDVRLSMPAVVWACARLGLYQEELLTSVEGAIRSKTLLASLPDWGLCALAWSYEALGQKNDLQNVVRKLQAEAAKRGFSQSDINSSQLGPFRWVGADNQPGRT